jgi:hypothetical protein
MVRVKLTKLRGGFLSMNVPLQQEELTMRLRRICGRCEYGDEGEEGGREDRVACTLIDDSVFGRLI